jgi:hypothetical protein
LKFSDFSLETIHNETHENKKLHSNIDKNMPKLLGAAFLLQALGSLIGGLIRDSIIGTGDITDSMTNISNNILLIRLSIVTEMITGFGVVLLGALLFLILKKQDLKIALVALGLYLLEVAAIAISSIALFGLLRISQESVIMGHPDYLQTLGTLFLEIHEFFFTVGATMFYYLFYKSGYLPQALAIFGLLVAILSLLGSFVLLLDLDIPIFVVLLLNLPFELGTGLWLLLKGIRDDSETK